MSKILDKLRKQYGSKLFPEITLNPLSPESQAILDLQVKKLVDPDGSIADAERANAWLTNTPPVIKAVVTTITCWTYVG